MVNLVTDGLPALALANDPAGPETMKTPPRPGAALFSGSVWRRLVFIGALVGGVTLVAFIVGRGLGGGIGQTMAFATLALSELALVYGMRSMRVPAWGMPLNRWLNLSVLASVAVVAVIVYLPAAHTVFETKSLGPVETLIAIALALLPLVGLELFKRVRRRVPEGPDGERPERRRSRANERVAPAA
jgi:P-type Ca2+ transporter type 2C